MKEPEPEEPRCPGCKGLGEPVGEPTLEAHLAADVRAPLGPSAFYCADPGCATAYFNGWGSSVPREKLTSTAYPKDPDAPVCSCFGLTAAEVVADARDGRKDRIKSVLERSEGPEARCVAKSPDGRCCRPLVSRLFRESFRAP